jgi:hypothetical protein
MGRSHAPVATGDRVAGPRGRPNGRPQERRSCRGRGPRGLRRAETAVPTLHAFRVRASLFGFERHSHRAERPTSMAERDRKSAARKRFASMLCTWLASKLCTLLASLLPGFRRRSSDPSRENHRGRSRTRFGFQDRHCEHQLCTLSGSLWAVCWFTFPSLASFVRAARRHPHLSTRGAASGCRLLSAGDRLRASAHGGSGPRALSPGRGVE